MKVIDLDFPEYFFLNITATKIWNIGLKTKIDIGYLYSINEIAAIEKQIAQKYNIIANSAIQGKSFQKKENALYTYLVKNVHYAEGTLSNPRLHNIVGALVDGIAVCEGYAKAFQYLCNKQGVLCMVVTGEATNAIDGTRGLHAWNIVRVHKKGCCHVDVTWDNIKCGRLIFNLKVKKNFSGNEEVLTTTHEIIERHSELMIKQYIVSYIATRHEIEYKFEKF